MAKKSFIFSLCCVGSLLTSGCNFADIFSGDDAETMSVYDGKFEMGTVFRSVTAANGQLEPRGILKVCVQGNPKNCVTALRNARGEAVEFMPFVVKPESLKNAETAGIIKAGIVGLGTGVVIVLVSVFAAPLIPMAGAPIVGATDVVVAGAGAAAVTWRFQDHIWGAVDRDVSKFDYIFSGFTKRERVSNVPILLKLISRELKKPAVSNNPNTATAPDIDNYCIPSGDKMLCAKAGASLSGAKAIPRTGD